MWLVIEDHDNLFVMAELVHFVGIGVLAWKLMRKKNAGGAHARRRRACCGAATPVAGPGCTLIHGQPGSMESSVSPEWHAGLSLRTQELTMIFLVIRLYCRYLRCPQVCSPARSALLLPSSSEFHICGAPCDNLSCIWHRSDQTAFMPSSGLLTATIQMLYAAYLGFGAVVMARNLVHAASCRVMSR